MPSERGDRVAAAAETAGEIEDNLYTQLQKSRRLAPWQRMLVVLQQG